MSVSFKGDFATLKRWERKLQKTPQLLPVISKNLAEETISLVQEGMARGVDPYGKRYAPLKIRSGQPLRNTGAMKSSWFHKNVSSTGFSVENARAYAIFHQEGTGIYGKSKRRIKAKNGKALRVPAAGGAMFFRSVKGTPRRMMVPDHGIPKRWRTAYVATTNEIFVSHFRSK
jgi:hypothetical protein